MKATPSGSSACATFLGSAAYDSASTPAARRGRVLRRRARMAHRAGVLLGLIAGLAAVAPTAAAGPADAGVGQVSLVIGSARVTHADGASEELRPGSVVFIGDRVVTGANGHAHIRFVDHGAVIVRPESALDVQAYHYDPARPQDNEVRFRVEHGTARSISGAATEIDKSRFRLNTPIAAIGVRGTDFVVQASASETRAFVAQGAIAVTPLGADCTAGSLGPCPGALARVLSADMGGVALVIRQGDQVARLAPGVSILLPRSAYAAEAAARERAGSEAAMRAAALASSLPSADPFSRTNDTTAADLLAIAPVARFDARLADPNAELAWGRWFFSHVPADNITVSFASALAGGGRQVTVGDADAGLFRVGASSTFSSFGSGAETGHVDLRLTNAQVNYQVNGRYEPAAVDGGTLALDFGRRTFATALALSNAEVGRVELRAGGAIDERGIFNAGDAHQRVSGAVTFDGKEAGYLFERAAGSGWFKGRTLWGKGP